MTQLLNLIAAITGMTIITGTHIPKQEIIVISNNYQSIVAWTTSDEKGEFRLEIPSIHKKGPLHLLAKVKTEEVCSIEYREVWPSEQKGPLVIKTKLDDLLRLDYSLLFTSESQASTTVFLDPVNLSGIPSELSRFFNWSSPNTKSSYFHRWAVPGPAGFILLPLGEYRIGGDQGNPDQPFASPQTSVIQVELLPDCRKLDGDSLMGFQLGIDGPTRIEMLLR